MLHTLEDFCAWAYPGCDKDALRRRYYQIDALSHPRILRRSYTECTVPKRNGGERVLKVPSPLLKQVQRQILRLLESAQLPTCATAYRKHTSLLQNAAPHTGRALVVKLDLADFFGSIRFRQVFLAIDRALRENPLVGAHYLNAYDRTEPDGRTYNRVLSFYFARLCTLDGALPQGAPTSPFLSNLVMAPIDRVLLAYCEKRGVAYTRYSDDLTFSGSFDPGALIGFVHGVLSANGFSLNQAKTAVLRRNTAQRVTGVTVNDRPQVSAAYRRKVRQELYYIEKFGLEAHLRWIGKLTGGETPEGVRPPSPALERCLGRLMGQVGFVLQIRPDDREFLSYRETLRRLIQTVN